MLSGVAPIEATADYSDPDGTQIDLTISRIASTNPEKRGRLMFSPDGPGGIGLDQPAFMVSGGLPGSVLDAYDLIDTADRVMADRNDLYGLGRTPEPVHRTCMATAARLDRTPG